MSRVDVSSDDIAWAKAYAAEVQKTFRQEFAAAVDRFMDGQVLLDRFNAAIGSSSY